MISNTSHESGNRFVRRRKHKHPFVSTGCVLGQLHTKHRHVRNQVCWGLDLGDHDVYKMRSVALGLAGYVTFEHDIDGAKRLTI